MQNSQGDFSPTKECESRFFNGAEAPLGIVLLSIRQLKQTAIDMECYCSLSIAVDFSQRARDAKLPRGREYLAFWGDAVQLRQSQRRRATAGAQSAEVCGGV